MALEPAPLSGYLSIYGLFSDADMHLKVPVLFRSATQNINDARML